MLFEIKVRYAKQTGDDNPKIVKEVYVIEGENFGDAESKLLKILIPQSFGNDIDIVAMKKVAPFDIVDCVAPEKVFKCKCVLIISDGEKESRKPIFLYVGATDFADCELAWTSFPTAVRKFAFRWQGMLQGDMKHKEERIHPTQKPITLYAWILRNYAKEGATIYDPFVGSGSSRIAAYKLGFDFTGCEIDTEYHAAQEARFRAECLG